MPPLGGALQTCCDNVPAELQVRSGTAESLLLYAERSSVPQLFVRCRVGFDSNGLVRTAVRFLPGKVPQARGVTRCHDPLYEE